MHSPFKFFIFVMRILFFADLIPSDISYSFEVFKNSLDVHLPFHSFLSLMHLFMHLLTSFSLCFSSLGVFLLSSMSLRISASSIDKSSITFAAADVVARFIIVVSDFAHVAAGMKHDRTCLFTLMWESCTKVFISIAVRMFFIFLCFCRTCFFLVYFSFDEVRALLRQSLPCQLVAAAAAA